MVPGSMAFIQDPQTVIENYIPHVVKRYFETVWHEENYERLIEANPNRFDMVQTYAKHMPDNFVYYAQNDRDSSHVANHFEPFASSVADPFKRRYVLYRGSTPGHGKINSEEFDYHYAEAMSYWRAYRQTRELQ